MACTVNYGVEDYMYHDTTGKNMKDLFVDFVLKNVPHNTRNMRLQMVFAQDSRKPWASLWWSCDEIP